MSSRMEHRYLREFGYSESEFNELAKKNNTDVYCLAASFKTKGRFNIGAYNYYVAKVDESDGYDVSGCDPNLRVSGGVVEISEDNRGDVIRFAEFAVEKHNEKEGTKLKAKEVVKANWQVVSGAMYYITFEAIDEQDDDKVKLYRAKVWHHPHMEEEKGAEMSLEEFYLAPQPVKEERKPGKKRKILSGTKRKSLPGTKRPFDIFVEDLRKLPEFETERFVDVLRTAGTRWRSMLATEKACYEERARSGSVGMDSQAQDGHRKEDELN